MNSLRVQINATKNNENCCLVLKSYLLTVYKPIYAEGGQESANTTYRTKSGRHLRIIPYYSNNSIIHKCISNYL